jgi:hypothetical protein
MIFKHYCAVFFNPTDGLNLEVSKISEGAPKYIPGRNISIFTFTSIVEVRVLTEYFQSYGRNFLIFDLDKDSSGFNLVDKEKENDLFGFLKDNKSTKEYEDLSNMLMDDFIKHSSNDELDHPDSSFVYSHEYINLTGFTNHNIGFKNEEISLEKQLELAVAEERYEEAAKLRDEIEKKDSIKVNKL